MLDKSQYKAQIDDIIKISIKNIYQSNEVIDKEISGYAILNTLLDKITTSSEHYFNNEMQHYDHLILNRIKEEIPEDGTLYNYLMESCNYISRLTDGIALLLFQKINGNL